MQHSTDGYYSFIDYELYEKLIELVSSSVATIGGVDGPKTVSIIDEENETNGIDHMPGFTEEEVAAARGVVEEYFRSIEVKDDEAILKTLTPMYKQPNVVLYGDETCTLLSIDYNEDDPMRRSYVMYGRGSINGTNIEDVIVFRVSFNVKYPEGVSGAFNEGDYTNWSIILIREDKESSWLIDGQGY